MEKTIVTVEGMFCSHCVSAITKAVGALDGVLEVRVDLEVKTVAVQYDASKVTPDSIRYEIEEQGYDVV